MSVSVILVAAPSLETVKGYEPYPYLCFRHEGKYPGQEISTLNKARSRQFDFAFARVSNCAACALSVGITLMVISGYEGAVNLTPLVNVFITAAQTSVEIGKAGADKSSSVQSEDKN